MARHQLQWRTREPESEWRFHSHTEQEKGLEQINHYHNRHHEKATFEYRLISSDSAEALERPVVEPHFLRAEGFVPFQFNR